MDIKCVSPLLFVILNSDSIISDSRDEMKLRMSEIDEARCKFKEKYFIFNFELCA